jgi:hypothetical protein
MVWLRFEIRIASEASTTHMSSSPIAATSRFLKHTVIHGNRRHAVKIP